MSCGTNIMEVAESLSEGFMTDKIISERDYKRAEEYVKDIMSALYHNKFHRIPLNIAMIKKYHRFNMFMEWLIKTYGNTYIRSLSDAELFRRNKLRAICSNTSDFDSFWRFLQNKTLDETSKLMPMGRM